MRSRIWASRFLYLLCVVSFVLLVYNSLRILSTALSRMKLNSFSCIFALDGFGRHISCGLPSQVFRCSSFQECPEPLTETSSTGGIEDFRLSCMNVCSQHDHMHVEMGGPYFILPSHPSASLNAYMLLLNSTFIATLDPLLSAKRNVIKSELMVSSSASPSTS